MQEACKSRDTALWKEGKEDEMECIISNQTWAVVDFPYDTKQVGCKWIFKKPKSDGSVNKSKARLVVKGFT